MGMKCRPGDKETSLAARGRREDPGLFPGDVSAINRFFKT
jgi:hypothetical protein